MIDKELFKELFKKTENELYDYTILGAEIENIKIEIEERQEEEYTGCSSISGGENVGPTNKFNSSVENEMLGKESNIERLKTELKNKERRLKKINNALATLNELEYEIIKLKYFDQLRKWEIIGQRVELTGYYCSSRAKDIVTKLSRVIFAWEYLKFAENS